MKMPHGIKTSENNLNMLQFNASLEHSSEEYIKDTLMYINPLICELINVA